MLNETRVGRSIAKQQHLNPNQSKSSPARQIRTGAENSFFFSKDFPIMSHLIKIIKGYKITYIYIEYYSLLCVNKLPKMGGYQFDLES